MRLHCSNCGESVSTEVPEGTIVRAYIECPECIEKRGELCYDCDKTVSRCSWCFELSNNGEKR